MKLEEKLMIFAGGLLLVGLLFWSSGGFYFWLAAKAIYGVGLVVMWTKREKISNLI